MLVIAYASLIGLLRDRGALVMAFVLPAVIFMARARYELGADDFITVLDAERTLADAEITLAQSQANTTQFQIGLFRALGGGWEQAPEVMANAAGL